MLHNIVQRVSIILYDSELNQLRWLNLMMYLKNTFEFWAWWEQRQAYANLVNSYVLTLWIWYNGTALYSVSNMFFIIPIWYSQYVWCYYLILQAFSMKAVPNANTLSKQKVLVTFILCRIYTTNNIMWTS